MSLTTAGIHCTISQRLSGAMENCFIVRAVTLLIKFWDFFTWNGSFWCKFSCILTEMLGNARQFTARTTTVTVYMYCWRLRGGGVRSNQSNSSPSLPLATGLIYSAIQELAAVFVPENSSLVRRSPTYSSGSFIVVQSCTFVVSAGCWRWQADSDAVAIGDADDAGLYDSSFCPDTDRSIPPRPRPLAEAELMTTTGCWWDSDAETAPNSSVSVADCWSSRWFADVVMKFVNSYIVVDCIVRAQRLLTTTPSRIPGNYVYRGRFKPLNSGLKWYELTCMKENCLKETRTIHYGYSYTLKRCMPREQDDTSWVFTRIINANDIG